MLSSNPLAFHKTLFGNMLGEWDPLGYCQFCQIELPSFVEDLPREIFKMSSPDRKWSHNQS